MDPYLNTIIISQQHITTRKAMHLGVNIIFSVSMWERKNLGKNDIIFIKSKTYNIRSFFMYLWSEWYREDTGIFFIKKPLILQWRPQIVIYIFDINNA